ncbi:MAG: 3-dehydroquinate synthase [SAR202 cluster bacterium]|nr:3-dehydroquinate synthase [SAR202 cluster bacterium]|tara:strand:+ start:18673 stop:20319 length:1647 start_codon:yes stop_codon:yes gene_type:complete
MKKTNIFLTGFSGTGKSTVGRHLAKMLGWTFVDTDMCIEKEKDTSISNIFEELGEKEFRKIESAIIEKVCSSQYQVVATGGGLVISEKNRKLMGQNGIIVCLEARFNTLLTRLGGTSLNPQTKEVRPLLESSDLESKIIDLKSKRQSVYSMSDYTVHTDDLAINEVSTIIYRNWRHFQKKNILYSSWDVASLVNTPETIYPICVGWGILDTISEKINSMTNNSVVYLVTDSGANKYARRVQAELESARIRTHLFVMESGEKHKTLNTVSMIYDWLAELKAERSHIVMAIGGGVVGDLAGFVAATYLRGVKFIQVPTTLLAIMDSSIGGKTGVDLDRGKNLVGAFYQPEFVLSDVEALTTLPQRQLISGWAEALKHGLIKDEGLIDEFEKNVKNVLNLDKEITTELIKRSLNIKAKVVSSDEHELLGTRIMLNYGHTIGHAIETAGKYEKLLHGEAVSIGMMAAGYISNALGILTSSQFERQKGLLEMYGLPIKVEGINLTDVKNAMLLDKKTLDGSIRWVLLDKIGHSIVKNDVPEKLISEALGSVII